MIIKDIYQEHLLNLRKFSLMIHTFSFIHSHNYFTYTHTHTIISREKEKKITVSHGNLMYSLCGRQLSTSVNIYTATQVSYRDESE